MRLISAGRRTVQFSSTPLNKTGTFGLMLSQLPIDVTAGWLTSSLDIRH